MNTAAEEKTHRTEGKPGLMRAGIILFAVGMIAVFAVFVLFAAGFQDLPVWLSAFAGVITPLGLGLGLIALVREHRQR